MITRKGDSMIDARIHDGDLVFVRKQEMVDNGEIAVVLIEDKMVLCQVYNYPDLYQMILRFGNAKYDPLFFEGEEREYVKILGKVIACCFYPLETTSSTKQTIELLSA